MEANTAYKTSSVQMPEKEKIKSAIAVNFNQATEDDYIHSFVNKIFKSKSYEDSNFFNNLRKIEIQAGHKIYLDSKRVNKWTPAHVAAIVNNPEAMKLFVRNGVSAGGFN